MPRASDRWLSPTRSRASLSLFARAAAESTWSDFWRGTIPNYSQRIGRQATPAAQFLRNSYAPDYGQMAPSEATDAREASSATRMEMRRRIVGTVLSVK